MTTEEIQGLFSASKKVAERLDIGVASVWRGVKLGRIPAPIHIGRSARWRLSDILALIAGGRAVAQGKSV